MLHDLIASVRAELAHLTAVQPSDRPWQMPFAASLAIGLPLLLAAAFDHLEAGLIASLGGLVFLYLPQTPLAHRMVTIMVCAFAMVTCYAIGTLSGLVPVLMMPVFVLLAIAVTMLCRFYRIGPPGSLFFVMAAAIGAYTPLAAAEVPRAVGLNALGAMLACVVALAYSLIMLRVRPPKPVEPLPPATFDFVVLDAVLIGVFVGLALAIAQLLQMEKAYWVPVSCLAVIQGATLRAVWVRQLHRIVGTAFGLVVAWGVLGLGLGAWGLALTMMVLACLIEVLVVRNYAMAAVLITPMTILLAEAGALGGLDPTPLVLARFYDTVLGCLVGLAGGACIHNAAVRERAGRWLRKLLPARLR